MAEYAKIAKKDTPDGLPQLMTQSARRFVRNIVDVTPPAMGRADSEAKKRGENAILSDLMKIAVPVAGLTRAQARELLVTAEDLLAVYQRSKTAAGRVNPRSRKEKLFLDQRAFLKVLKQLQARVGFLASGMNVAAQKLGIRLPAWIARHGTRFGGVEVEFSTTRLRVRVVQNVPYAAGVDGYSSRWNFAFNKEIATLQKMITALRAKAGMRAAKHMR